MNNLVSTWADDLYMQHSLYGKIKDKYPENLMSHHARVARKIAIINEIFDKEKFSEMDFKAAS